MFWFVTRSQRCRSEQKFWFFEKSELLFWVYVHSIRVLCTYSTKVLVTKSHRPLTICHSFDFLSQILDFLSIFRGNQNFLSDFWRFLRIILVIRKGYLTPCHTLWLPVTGPWQFVKGFDSLSQVLSYCTYSTLVLDFLAHPAKRSGARSRGRLAKIFRPAPKLNPKIFGPGPRSRGPKFFGQRLHVFVQ